MACSAPPATTPENATLSSSASAENKIPLPTGNLNANVWLWQASLDTLSFLPLSMTDSAGGVIITEWYALPEEPDRQYKVTLRIYGQELRADALDLSVFRRARAESRQEWVSETVSPQTLRQLGDIILTRARALRLRSREQ